MTNGPIKRGSSHRIIDNAETRVGRGKIRKAIYGRDAIGMKMSDEDRRKLLHSGGEDIVEGIKKGKKKK